jgi:WD40 repeat protein
LETRRTAELPYTRASYEDILRQYNHTSPNQLELALESVASMDKSTWGELPPPNNLFHVAQEMQYSHGSGKRLGETVDLTKENVSIDLQDFNICSILHPMPLLHRKQEDSNSDPYSEILPYQGPEPSKADSQKSMSLSVLSDYEALGKATGEAVRSFLCSRQELRRIEEEIAVLQQNIFKHEELQSKTEMKRQRIISNSQETHKSALQSPGIEVMAPDELMQQEILDSSRVIAQMRNKVFQQTQKLEGIKEQVVKAEKSMRQLCKTSKDNVLHFRDPFQTRKFHSLSCSLTDSGLRSRFQLLDLLSTRQVGISSFRTAKQIGVPSCVSEAKETRKSILSSRFAHSVTINAHLSFPIYCLQFDKTGRYFITGADDSLVKLFCLGAAQSRTCSKSKKSLTFTYGANGHGAILVCTLRGHAGVICDIDVSSDNALVATASDDGDVRVWGLKDGCPVAILRGHKGGANMVSWSKITPYRLVSVGMDGLARIWDVREAALKRYGSLIGNRMEYTLPLLESEKKALELEMEKRHRHFTENNGGNQAYSLPSEPLGESEGSLTLVDPAALVALPEPILGVNRQEIFEEGIFDEVSVPSIDGNLGAFHANDNLDEGVKIIARLKHGDSIQSSGPGTRSRLKQVKVICVARCPIGGHFATGSDDGLCRIWEDEDDELLALIDCRDGSPSKMRNVPIENSTGKFRQQPDEICQLH